MATTTHWVSDFSAFTATAGGYGLVLTEGGAGISTEFLEAGVAGNCYAAAAEMLGPAMAADLIELWLKPRNDGALSVRISPGRQCGFATLGGGAAGHRISIEVRPKIDATNIFSLLALSGDPERFILEQNASLTNSDQVSLLQLLGVAYGNALRQLLRTAGLRGLHETKHERLPFRIRGKIVVGEYLKEYAAGRQHVFPCTYPTLTLDNRINRLLRWALHTITAACRQSKCALPALEALEAAFAGVQLEPSKPVIDVNRLRLPGGFDHYWETGAIQLAEMILKNSSLGAIGGGNRSAAVAVPMHQIFETAFARVIASWSRLPVEQIFQQEWRIRAGRSETAKKGGTFIPDIVLPPQSNRKGLVADTKWKSGINEGLQGDLNKVFLSISGIKLYNADIYQMLGYMSAAKDIYGSEFVGVLVYPIADAPAASLAPLRLFVGSDQKPSQLYLLPWEVGASCFECLPELWRTIDDLRFVDVALPCTHAVELQAIGVPLSRSLPEAAMSQRQLNVGTAGAA